MESTLTNRSRTFKLPSGLLAFLLILSVGMGYAQTTIYSTNFGTTAVTSASTFVAGWTSANYQTGGASPTNMSIATTSVSSTYTTPITPSGGANLADGSAGTIQTGTATAILAGQVNTTGYSNIQVTFGYRASSATYTGVVTLDWSADGTNWNAITLPTLTRNGTWIALSYLTLPAGAEGQSNLRFRFQFNRATTGGNFRIDDFTVQGTAAITPAITPSSSTLTGFNYLQGSGPSSNQSLTLSAANLTTSGNVTVTGSTNYEVSTNGTTFSSSVTYPYAGGTITGQPVTLYVRLKSGLTAGSYNSESISISGGGASTSITASGSVTAVTPSITPSTASLSGYSYILGAGPSASQSFTFTGANLTGFPSNITVTGSTNYEVSTNNSTFSGSVTYPYSSATLTTQTVYVRLKTGLSATNYSENITISGGGITPVNIANTGNVIQPFSLGNIVVSRMGATGQGTAPTSAATAIFFDEYSTAGTGTSSFALPTATSGSLNRITGSGSATSENMLNLSADGRYLSIGGYDLATGTASANGAANPRVIMRTDKNGTMSSTAIGLTHTSGFRSVTSYDGSSYWTAGNGIGVTNVAHQGSTTVTTPTTVSTTQTNLRYVGIFNNQLYYSTGSAPIGIKQVGSGLPTTTGTVSTTAVPATGDPYQFYMVNRGTNKWNCYAAYQSTPGIFKFSTSDNGATWTARGSVTTIAVEGIVAKVVGSTVEVYGTTASNIIKLTDVAAYDANISATSSTIATAPTNTFFRGLSFAPAASGLIVSNYSLSGFNYEVGNGPSAAQSFTVSGSTLSGNITLTAPTNYEISLSAGSGYTSALSITPASGTVAATTIYVRLKTGLAEGLYNDEAIACSATGAYSQTVYCSGGVLPNVNVSVSASTGSEVGTSVITVTATASAAVTVDQTVDVLVTGTSITAGDYSLTDGDLVTSGTQIKILSGSTTGSITFTVVDDILNEGTETAQVAIGNPTSGLVLGTTQTQNISITDNDDAVILTAINTPSTTTDFNNLVITGTSSEVSQGAYYLETGTNQNTVYSTTDGSVSTGDTYSYGTGVSTDRALGSNITSGLADVKVGFKLKNTTGGSFNAVVVSYDGEQWRRGVTGNAANGGAAARDKLKFEYSTSASSLGTGTWGATSILNFNSPDFGTATTDAARNGNTLKTAISDTMFLPSGIANNGSLWVRWTHNTTGTSGTRDGLGIDNVVFTPINYTPLVYYTDTIGNLDQLTTWFTNPDGTGANPSSFAGSNQTFIVQNRATATIGSNWTISGSNSKLRIRNGVEVTIPDAYSFVGLVDSLEGTAILNLNNAVTPTLNGIESTTTVSYGSLSNQDIAVPQSTNNQYGNLILTGTGTKRVIGGFRVEGNYDFTNASLDATAAFSVVFFKKNITSTGTLTSTSNYNTYVNLQAYGTSAQTINGNGNTIKAGRLLMNVANTSGTLISAGSDLKTGSLSLAANTNLVLSDDIKLNINAAGTSFNDNGNTISVGGDLECAGVSSGYHFTGSIILNGSTGTANIRQDGASGSGLVIKAVLNNLSIQTAGSTITQVQPTSGNSTLVINGDFSIAGTSTGKFTPNGNTIQLAGNFSDSRNIDMIAAGTSTFEFNGSAAQTFSSAYTVGESFYNVTLNNSNGLTLTSGNLKITGTGTLTFTSGSISTGSNKVILNNAANVVETPTENVVGLIETTRNIIAGSLESFGGMGLQLTALGNAPGSTVALRETGNSSNIGCTASSVLRKFTLTPTVNSGLNATITYSYFTNELNSIPEAGLALYTGSTPWTSISTAVNTGSNSITATGINAIGTLVAGAASLPTLNLSSTTIDASNPTRLLAVTAVLPNTNYVWSPATDLYTDASLTIPYVAGTNEDTVYAAPFSTVTYNVTASNTLISCTTSPVSVLVNVDPALTNDICLANLPAGLVTVTSTPTFVLRSLTGATASPGAACVAINKDIWFRAVVPANGEIHVTTQQHDNPTASLNINSALVQIFTAATCSTGLSQVACNSGGAAANMAYAAATGLTPGSTVFIRLARTTAGNAAPSQYIRMAVTSGLVWTGAADNTFSNPANWLGGDATALTVPAASSSIIVPTLASAVYPVISSGTQSVHGIEFNNSYSVAQTPTITLNAGAELRLVPSAVYRSFINRSGLFAGITTPKVLGQGTLRFNEGGLNSGEVFCPVRFYGVVAVRAGVTVASNGYMRFENNSVLLSGGVATADITKNYSGTVTGNIVYSRTGSLYGGYNYWSSPVNGATTGVLSSNYGNNIYQYDNTLAGGSIQGAWGSPITSPIPMQVGRGYIQTYAGNGTVNFIGAPNQTSVNYPVTVTGSNNFNLIGNPYPSSLSYTSLKTTNSNLGAVYLWHSTTPLPYNTSAYVVMSGLGVLAGNPVAGFTNAEIGAGQGFLAQVSAAGNIAFNSDQRVAGYPGNALQFLEQENDFSIIKLRLSNSELTSFDAVIGFGQNGTDAEDFGYDAPRMPSSENLEVFSMIGENQYTTQLLPQLNSARVIDLGTALAASGTYTFNLNMFDNFDPSVRVYLEDRKTGDFQNLNAAPNYTFSNDPAFEGTRFRLHFMAPVALESTATCNNVSAGKVIVSNPNPAYPMQARLKDNTGNIVAAQQNIESSYTFENLMVGSYLIETSFDGTDFIANAIEVQSIASVENANILSSAANVTIDQANIAFTTQATGATQINWNFGDGSVAQGNVVNHTYTQAGIYTVTMTAGNGLCTTTQSLEIAVTDIATGINNVNSQNGVIAFPIPANDKLTVITNNNDVAQFELRDLSGKLVQKITLTGSVNIINTSNLEAGVYMANIRQNNSTQTIRVVVAH